MKQLHYAAGPEGDYGQITLIFAIWKEAATTHFQMIAQKEHTFEYADFSWETEPYFN